MCQLFNSRALLGKYCWEKMSRGLNLTNKNQPTEVFFKKKTVLKNFTILTGKHLCWGLFFYKKLCLPVIARNKNISKQDAPITNTLWRKLFFLQLLLLKVCHLFLSRVKKLVIYSGLWEPSSDFQRRQDQINTVHER